MSDDRLYELRARYAWFDKALREAHAEGKVEAESVRFFVDVRQLFLYGDDGEPVLDSDGEAQYDPDAEPIYFGCAQAYSYVGDPPRATVAGCLEVALQLLDQAAARSIVLEVVCEDLNAAYERELAVQR